jgi:hypothetical protein
VDCIHVAARREEHIDDLAELVDRTIDLAPAARDLQAGLVDLPAVSDDMPTRSGSLGKQRGEPQHPLVDRDVVDLDAAFGEQLLDVALGQAKAQVPADGKHDHIRREAETGEGRPCNRIGPDAASSHDTSLAARDPVSANATEPASPGSTSNNSTRTSRSSALGSASAKATGRPCKVQIRCSRSPQN